MNNKAVSFAFCEPLDIHTKLIHLNPILQFLVRVFGDSQLMIHFIAGLFKKPNHYCIYWALEQTKNIEQ